jgi:N-acetylmuramoyl-L-alanine amidase
MIIREQFVRVNRYTRPAIKNSGIKGVVWHYTASPKASAQNIRNYFDGTCIADKRYASAHVTIDKKEVIIMIPFNEIAYHAHDRNRCLLKQLQPNANFTAIGVELCIDANSKLESETYANAVEYGVVLCKKYGFDPRKDFFRHYDVTEKNCPAFWVADPAGFNKFKQDVYNKLHGGQPVNPAPAKPAPKPVSPKYALPTGVLKRGDKGNAVKQLQSALNALNFNCGTVDGDYGAKTEDALRRFQKVYDPSNVDGIYGERTRTRLNNLLNK